MSQVIYTNENNSQDLGNAQMPKEYRFGTRSISKDEDQQLRQHLPLKSCLINGNNHCERRVRSVPIDHGQSRLWSHNAINNNHHHHRHSPHPHPHPNSHRKRITPSSLDDHPANGQGFRDPQLDNHVIREVNDNCCLPQARECSSDHFADDQEDAFSTSISRNSPPQIERQQQLPSHESTRHTEKPSCLSKSKSESFSKPSPPQRQVKFLDDCQIETATKAVPLPYRLKVKMDESTTTTSSSTNTITTTTQHHHQQQQQQHHHQSSHHVTIVDHRSGSNPQITIDEYAGEYPLHEDNAFRTKIDSSYEGWDNPFRPEGQLSHEAEELLRLWREGKLKHADGTPIKDEPDAAFLESTAQAQKNQSNNLQANGKSSANPGSSGSKGASEGNGNSSNGDMKNGGKPLTTDTVKRENMPQLGTPGRVQHVTLGDDKGPKKKKGCCTIM
ncbi:uncharacterized protein LOC131885472 isoform X2 [Tigriopus californicus]|uniref:uncharacterized protein LOC131885472 isoform X2 n=1 Tax=Tigriopus californicus TaxID=6832 RepID=UPI0027D9D8B8|nr:uncharacterized protein LOC131885472 isoform X2 [Tigriopus californicus]